MTTGIRIEVAGISFLELGMQCIQDIIFLKQAKVSILRQNLRVLIDAMHANFNLPGLQETLLVEIILATTLKKNIEGEERVETNPGVKQITFTVAPASRETNYRKKSKCHKRNCRGLYLNEGTRI